MYKTTRQEAAEILNISTRSIDRYIKSWKIRSKKKWKIVYVNNSDIKNLWKEWNSISEIIITKPKKINEKSENKKNKDKKFDTELSMVYLDLKDEIHKKDTIIQTLAMRVWKSEEIAKNSVSMIEFKKSQYLLEESKQNINNQLNELELEKHKLMWELKYEKTSNKLLIVFVVTLLLISLYVLFYNI